MSGDIFGCRNGGGCHWPLVARVRDSAWQPTQPRTCPRAKNSRTPKCQQCHGRENPLRKPQRSCCMSPGCPALGFLVTGRKTPNCFSSWVGLSVPGGCANSKLLRQEELFDLSSSQGHLQMTLPLDYPYWHFPRPNRVASPIYEAERGQPFGSFFCQQMPTPSVPATYVASGIGRVQDHGPGSLDLGQ